VDLAESHMVAGFMVKRNLPNGTRLILVDPNPNGLELQANAVLKAARGSDADVLMGLRAGLVKLGLVEGDSASQTLATAAEATGIEENDFITVAGMIGTASQPVILYGKGITAGKTPDTLRSLVEFGRLANAGLLSIKGEANSLAAAQYGLQKPFQVNGHQAVYIALGDDTPSQRLVQRVEKAPFLAVQASYVSRLTAMADVVLPVAMWAEEEGHYVNLEGRVQKANPALEAPIGVRTNEGALKALAGQLGIETDENWEAALCSRPAPVTIGSAAEAAA
jgi:predicted molibdopterin-dependent oxidoreductase YjgC